MNKFIKSISQFIISTSNATLEVALTLPTVIVREVILLD